MGNDTLLSIVLELLGKNDNVDFPAMNVVYYECEKKDLGEFFCRIYNEKGITAYCIYFVAMYM